LLPFLTCCWFITFIHFRLLVVQSNQLSSLSFMRCQVYD
jgi:hypothetical protein